MSIFCTTSVAGFWSGRCWCAETNAFSPFRRPITFLKRHGRPRRQGRKKARKCEPPREFGGRCSYSSYTQIIYINSAKLASIIFVVKIPETIEETFEGNS